MIRAAITRALAHFIAERLRVEWQNQALNLRVRELEDELRGTKRELSKCNGELNFVADIVKGKTVDSELAKQIEARLRHGFSR